MVQVLASQTGHDRSGTLANLPTSLEPSEAYLADGQLRVQDDTDTKGVVMTAIATYDFAVNGGAISAIDLGITIPNNAVVLDGMIDVITTATSATDAGTMAIHLQSANDIVSAAAISASGWDAGLTAIIPLGTAASAIKLTAARAVTATIAVEAFTAGKFHVIIRYVVTD